MVESKLFTVPVNPAVVRVLFSAKVPLTSLSKKFARNLPSGAAVYLKPCLVTLTLSTAPMSSVSARRTALEPKDDVTETLGKREYPSPPSLTNIFSSSTTGSRRTTGTSKYLLTFYRYCRYLGR